MQSPSKTDGSLLTIAELAMLLRVPTNTIYYWVHRNEIPHLKVGRHLRFQRDVVIAFFENRARDSKPPCLPLEQLIQHEPWFGGKSLRGSLTTREGALLKKKGVSNGN